MAFGDWNQLYFIMTDFLMFHTIFTAEWRQQHGSDDELVFIIIISRIIGIYIYHDSTTQMYLFQKHFCSRWLVISPNYLMTWDTTVTIKFNKKNRYQDKKI